MNSWLSNILFTLFIACMVSCHVGKNFSKIKLEEGVTPTMSRLLDLGDTIYKYKTVVHTYGKTISGILLLKPQDDDTLKATFVSTAGLKLFDMCILKDTFIVAYATPMLEKFETLKTLANSINVASHWSVSEYKNPRKGKLKSQDWVLYDYKNEFIATSTNTLKYLYGNKMKEKFTVEYEFDSSNPPTKINIDYTRFDLNISLEKITE